MDFPPDREQETCDQLLDRVIHAIEYLSEQRDDPNCSEMVKAQAHHNIGLLVSLQADLEGICEEEC
jgi:hypothetical protein